MTHLTHLSYSLSIVGLCAMLAACTPPTKQDPTKPATSASAQDLPSAQSNTPIQPSSKLSTDDQTQPIAVVGPTTVTLGEYERRLNAQAPFARSRYNSVERKKDFLDNIVRFEVLALEAQRLGYDKNPEVLLNLKQAMVRKMMADKLTRDLKPSDIPEKDIQEWYESHKKDYIRPEKVRASQIVFKDQASAAAALKELQALRGESPSVLRKAFALKARDVSIDPTTAARGGDMGFFARHEEGGTVHPNISKVLFDIKDVGTLAGPVQSDQGWHILVLTARKQRYERTLDEARREITNRLYRERRIDKEQRFVDDLKSKSKITIHYDLLKTIEDPPQDPSITPHRHGHDDGHIDDVPPKPPAKLKPAPKPKTP